MSRLRNRMVKAEFWTDPDLLSWTRDKRFFYMGLRAAAEDSGCIEDSPFGWMLVLYPSPLDRDISIEQVTAWRDELISDGKLVRYRVSGKDYLYQATFHNHEHPRNPQGPNLPLPPWVTWTQSATDARKGRYESSYESVPAPEASQMNLVQPLNKPCTTVVLASPSSPALPCSALSSPAQSNGEQEEHLSTTAAVPRNETPQDPDPFDDLFWPRWPNRHGSKQLSKSRFRALTAPQQQRCLVAEKHLVEAISRGSLSVEYQPRAENFIGGSKQYYREWADGPPPKYASAGTASAQNSYQQPLDDYDREFLTVTADELDEVDHD